MLLPSPQIHLIKSGNGEPGNPVSYTVHSVTLFDKTNYEPTPAYVLSSEPDSEGMHNLTLNVTRVTGPDFPLLTPVVHTIDIGNLFTADYPVLRISVHDDGIEAASATVHKDQADEDVKPLS